MLENIPRSCEGKDTAEFCHPPFPPNITSHKPRVIFAFGMQGAKALLPARALSALGLPSKLTLLL